MSTKIFCDRCEREVEPERAHGAYMSYPEPQEPGKVEGNEYDLCNDCYEAVVDVLEGEQTAKEEAGR